MPTPPGWPPPPSDTRPSLRVYVAGTASANFADNAYLFADFSGPLNPLVPPTPPDPVYTRAPNVAPGETGKAASFTGLPVDGWQPRDGAVRAKTLPVPPPKLALYCTGIGILNLGGSPIEFSFDGTNVHGVVPGNSYRQYTDRREAGIALRGAGMAFRLEAW